MTSAESQYFALLRAALWDTPVAIDGAIDWQRVMSLAQFHANSVLVSDVALRLPNEQQPDADLRLQMQYTMRTNLFRQLNLKQILLSAVKLLREHDIEPVLLKGFSLALLYPNPSLRQFGDIDLFVGLDRFHEACALMRTLPGGYNWGGEVDAGHHYNIEFGEYPMEIHRVSTDVDDPAEYAIYSQIEHDGLVEHRQQVDFEGFEVTIPSKEFMVFFTFFHAWHHFLTTGVGWRQISDMAMTLHAYYGQLDNDKLRRWLADMHLMQPWQTFGWLMVNCLGLPEAEMPFYDAACRRRAQKLYRRIMEEGNFKRKSSCKEHKLRKVGIERKFYSFVLIFVDFFRIAKVFPGIAFRRMKVMFHLSLKKKFKKNRFFCSRMD